MKNKLLKISIGKKEEKRSEKNLSEYSGNFYVKTNFEKCARIIS